MEMIAHNPAAAHRLGVPQSVGQEFVHADLAHALVHRYDQGGQAPYATLSVPGGPFGGGANLTVPGVQAGPNYGFGYSLADALKQQRGGYGAMQGALSGTQGLVNSLQYQAAGGGPNLAALQYQQNAEQNAASAASAAASRQGLTPAQAARMIGESQAAANAGNAMASAQLRGQQQLSAQEQLAGALGMQGQIGAGMTGAGQSLYGTAGQLALGQNLQGLQAQEANQNNLTQLQLGAMRAATENANQIPGLIGGISSGVGSALGMAAMAASGGQIPGHPQVPGDSPVNDQEPALLSPGEIVIPRSIALHPNAPELSAHFVAAVKAGVGPRPSFADALLLKHRGGVPAYDVGGMVDTSVDKNSVASLLSQALKNVNGQQSLGGGMGLGSAGSALPGGPPPIFHGLPGQMQPPGPPAAPPFPVGPAPMPIYQAPAPPPQAPPPRAFPAAPLPVPPIITDAGGQGRTRQRMAQGGMIQRFDEGGMMSLADLLAQATPGTASDAAGDAAAVQMLRPPVPVAPPVPVPPAAPSVPMVGPPALGTPQGNSDALAAMGYAAGQDQQRRLAAAATPPSVPDEIGTLKQAGKEGEAAAIAQGKAETEGAQNEEQTARQNYEAQQAAIQQIQAENAAHQKKLDDAYSGKIEPDHWWKSRSTPQKISAALGVAFGAFGAGLAHTQNFAQQMIDKAIDEDINSQRDDKNSRVAKYLQEGHDLDDAHRLTLADAQNWTAANTATTAARNKGLLAAPTAMANAAARKAQSAQLVDQAYTNKGQRTVQAYEIQAMKDQRVNAARTQEALAGLDRHESIDPVEYQTLSRYAPAEAEKWVPIAESIPGQQTGPGRPVAIQQQRMYRIADPKSKDKVLPLFEANSRLMQQNEALQRILNENPHGAVLDRRVVSAAKSAAAQLATGYGKESGGGGRMTPEYLSLLNDIVAHPDAIMSKRESVQAMLDELRSGLQDEHENLKNSYLVRVGQ